MTFKDGGADITDCVSKTLTAGSAVCAISNLSVGSHSITAVYSGDANYATSTSNPITQVVNRASSSVALDTSGSPIAYGKLVTFTATIGPLASTGTVVLSDATGTVTFKDGGVDITGCGSKAVTVGSAMCATSNLSVGSHSITAVYSGDTNYLGSTSTLSPRW